MLNRRRRQIKKKSSKEDLIHKYQAFLSNMIVLPEMNNDIQLWERQTSMTERLSSTDISKKEHRKILLHEIYDFKQFLTGNEAAQLESYFFGLGLQEEVMEMLNANSWTYNLMGLNYVLAFDISECLPKLDQLIMHPNKDVSFHALITKIFLTKEYNRLVEMYAKLSDWEKHKIHNIATNQGVVIENLIQPNQEKYHSLQTNKV